MKKTSVRWLQIIIMCLVTILIVSGESHPALAESSSPAEQLQQAWRYAQEAGSYRFISDIKQTLNPRPVPSMIGQQETTLNLAIDGAIRLPDQAYSEMKVNNGPQSKAVVMLRDGTETFVLQDGALKPVDISLNLATQGNDLLGYLAAADQVTLLDPPPGYPSWKRFGFVINGPRYAEYVRQQAQAAMQAEPGTPQGLTLKPIPSLQQLSGRGELWVDQNGLPVRQVIDLNMPQVNDQYSADIHMLVSLSSYGKVGPLPEAVQGPDGTWHMEGTLAPVGTFPAAPTGASQQVVSAEDQKTGIAASLPWQISSTDATLIFLLVLAIGIVVFYLRRPRRCHALLILFLIPVMVFSPLLQTETVQAFIGRQAQATKARQESVPELLHTLGINADLTGSQTNSSADSAGLSPQAVLDKIAANKPEGAPIYDGINKVAAGDGQQALKTCGYGVEGLDTDSDGLTDKVEYCLGTSADNADSDGDSIPDGVEVIGFDFGGQHWDSDPLSADSNRDGILDAKEWSKERATYGQSVSDDIDGDNIPNLWDDDNDGDLVPDGFDLSPDAITGYKTSFDLNSTAQMTTGTEAIEIEVQPQEKDLEHLRYSTTILDWPPDEEGNIRDLDGSSEDLRLVPFLLIKSNVQPSSLLLEQYSVRSWYDEEEGKYVLLVSLQPLEDGGAIYAFYGKVAYPADQTTNIQWNIQLVWMAQMQLDENVCHNDYYLGRVCEVETTPTILHQYQETFRITGLQVTNSQGYEATVMGSPAMTSDDLNIFKMLVGLSNTFQSYRTLEGQNESGGETALDQIYTRFTNNDPIAYHRFGIPEGSAAVAQPGKYLNTDAGLADMSSRVLPEFLNLYPAYSSSKNCKDAQDNDVTCATLILASETHSGIANLSDLRGSDPRMVAGERLVVNLAEYPIVSVRSTTLRMYEKSASGTWATMTPARMLEMVEARYHGIYGTTLSDLFPSLRAQDARFIAYTGYLWAYAGMLTVISVDGQSVVPELPDEAANALATAVANESAKNGLNYIGLASTLPSILSDTFNEGQAIFDIVKLVIDHANLSKAVIGGKATLSAFGIAASLASMIMNCINTACATNPDLPMCARETGLIVANVLVATFVISVQVTAITVSIISAIIDKIDKVVATVSVSSVVMGFIGAGIGIIMTWVSFGIVAGTTSSDPVAWRMSLGMAIVTTVWLIILACINFIPVIGPIITAILGLIDYIISLFTGLFANKQWSLAQIILEFFYSAETKTAVESAAFGAFTSSLKDPNLGLVGGNTFKFSVPASGVLTTLNGGSSDDLNASYIKGEMQPLQDPANPQPNPFAGEAENEDKNCPITGGKANCSNMAIVGFALEPRINGTVTFVARILYQTLWKEYMFYGSVRVDTHYVTGKFPETDSFNTLYLDVLPATLTELWHWQELGNPDLDGDGLSEAEEQQLGTDPALWDTDGDGLSDRYEWEMGSVRGSDPLKSDTDGDGLNDAIERRIGTRINLADSDGDGLTDGEELRHVENGVLVGGWQINQLNNVSLKSSSKIGLTSANTSAAALINTTGYRVSSDPLVPDDDGDSLNASEEKLNGISPQARNALVPELQISVTPIADIPDARPGSFWLPGTGISLVIKLANVAYQPVTAPLSVTLPAWIDSIEGGTMQGDRTVPMNLSNHTLTWDFSGENALQLYEVVSATVTARVNPATLSASDEITADMNYGGVLMHKLLRATVDGNNPIVSIISPANGTYLRGTSLVLGGSTVDPTTWITQRSLSIVPSGSATSYTALPLGQGPWAYTWSLPTTDGVYSLRARAVDAMNHSAETSVVNVTVDNTPPSATLTWQMDKGTVHLSGTASDNLAGVEWVQLMIDGQPWRNVPLNGTAWSFDWSVGENAQGDHTVSVRAIDRSRNQSAVTSSTIVVDSVAPSSSVTSGADAKVPPAVQPGKSFILNGVANEGGHLPLPAAPVNLASGMDVLDDSTVWLGLSSIRDNDGGVLAAWTGDFNADRLADLAVGLPGPAGSAGQVVMLYGRAGEWPISPTLEMLATSPTHFTGAPGTQLGSIVAAAGDVNADSRDDLLIGGRASRDAFLVFGTPGQLGSLALQTGQSGSHTLLRAPANIENLATAGDVDGDGRSDLLITAGGTAYLLLGQSSPWPEVIDIAAAAVKSFSSVSGALGVGDVDNDQRAEWVTLSSGVIQLYGWSGKGASGSAEPGKTETTADSAPRAAALGYVDQDQTADWAYTSGTDRVLVYGSGAKHTFSHFDGLLAAPGDVNGDGWAELLLTDAAGVASLISQPAGGSPGVIATINGVGGAANAPYVKGADLNADGSADLVLIPNQAAAETHGFDAPDFSSGFISPQMLPLGTSSVTQAPGKTPDAALSKESASRNAMTLQEFGIESIGTPDVRYVDDDGVCDGSSPCFTTIQAAVNASDGGGDRIVIYPGVYPAFSVPAGSDYDHLTVEGVSADAVFVEGGAGNAISIAADGVRLANLTVRNAASGVALENGAGEATWAGGEETSIDHLLAHSVQYPISMSQSAALTLSDSTLVGNGVDPILNVSSTLNPAVHTWNEAQTMSSPPATNGGIASSAGTLYAMAGGSNPQVYSASPGTDGAIGAWTPAFRVPQEMPSSPVKSSMITAGGGYFYQLKPKTSTPDFGAFNGEVRAVAIAPNGDIYAGGNFTQITGVDSVTTNIARWDGTSWHPLGAPALNGVDGPVYAITITSNGDVFVGGSFSRAFNGAAIDAYNIVRWSSNNWHVLGSSGVEANGTDGPVYALARSSDDMVMIGGDFEYVRASYNGYKSGEFALVQNFAIYNETTYASSAGWFWKQGLEVMGVIRNMAWTGGNMAAGRLYAAGQISAADTGTWAANNVIVLNITNDWSTLWRPLGSGLSATGVSVTDIAYDPTTQEVYASSDGTEHSIYRWNGTTWSSVFHSGDGIPSALAADAHGNIFAGMDNGDVLVYRSNDSSSGFDSLENEGQRIYDLVPYSLLPDRSGQVLVARGMTSPSQGAVRWVGLEGIFRRSLTGTSWSWITYPISFSHGMMATSAAVDGSGNLYVAGKWSSYIFVYRLKTNSTTWELRASLSWSDTNPELEYSLTNLVWANGSLYALAHSNLAAGEKWFLFQHNPTSPSINPNDVGPSVGWTQIGETGLPAGAASATSRSLVWDGLDSIYVLQASGTYRCRISTHTWDVLPAATSFTISQTPALALAGNNLYAYATPKSGISTNLFRYGAVGLPDVRLTITKTALVEPESANTLAWTNLPPGGTYAFQIVSNNTNAWVSRPGGSWSPALPDGAPVLTPAQAAFAAPEDDLYRLGPDSELTAGYHHYMAVAHVYPSQVDCAGCKSGSLAWGVTAFDTIRAAVESGAARVLIHPGRYPQTFYLVSGVEVTGSGAETTIIEPPASPAATLVTAEGAAGASLARVTLAGGASWDGFLAEGGATGLKLTRTIIRDLHTGVTLRNGSEVEIVNNTIVENTNGIVISEDITPVNVRNTILAYNSGTGLAHSAHPNILSNTYNDFWANGIHMNPETVSLGSLFVDPRFRDLTQNDLRLAENSYLIDMGAPNDSTIPGGGERVDIGYAEYNSAGFYVSQSYSETGLNDGLTWGIDAFDKIQPALDAAAAMLHSLRGALPEGGFSVAVAAGTYPEQVSVPSYVRLVGSGAEKTIIDAGAAGSGVTFDGVIASELSNASVKNAGGSGAGVEIKNASNGIKISRSIIHGSIAHGISLAGKSSAEVTFNTIVGSTGAGVYVTGAGSWVNVHNSILDGNGTGLQADSGGLIRNDYNLLHNASDLGGAVTAGTNTVYGDAAFTDTTLYVPSAGSPALDAAEPWAQVPLAGGLRADLGYKELIASPLTVIFGPQIDSKVTGNSGVAKVELGVVWVSDENLKVSETLPTTWETLTPTSSGQPYFYWTHNESQTTPGLYRVYSRATDQTGNTETNSDDWYEGAFVVDEIAPSLAWATPPAASTDAAAMQVSVNAAGSVSAISGTRNDVAQVYFNVSGTDEIDRYYPAQNGQAWIQFPKNDTYTIDAVAVDEAGNSTTLSAAVQVNAGSSAVTVSNFVTNTAVNTTQIPMRGFVRFQEAGTGSIEIKVSELGGILTVTPDEPGETFSTWSALVNLPAINGTRTISLTPKMNGISGTTTTLTTRLDGAAPRVSILEPSSTVQQIATFSGHADDNPTYGGVMQRVEVSIDGGYTWRQASLSGPAYEMDWSLAWDMGVDHDFVTYPVQVRAIDSAGNITLLKSVVTVDNVPPTHLAPVSFDPPVGQHVDLGTLLNIQWNLPVDASGATQVLMEVDENPQSTPTTLQAGTSASATLNQSGDLYVHLIAQDASGNQTIADYGPWHVRNVTASPFDARRESIITDGYIDLKHDEWQASDLLGSDARSGTPQELYLSVDGEAVYLGWSGAWWTLDGVLWAYLDTSPNPGAVSGVTGGALPGGLTNADRAVEIHSPVDGTLWTWTGTAWLAGKLDFAGGPSGDTEVRIPWSPTDTHPLSIIAFALPRAAEETPLIQAQSQAGKGLKTLANTSLEAVSPEQPINSPWAVFPTTNPLAGTLTEAFTWSSAALDNPAEVNLNQPTARTVFMTASSPQASNAAWCANNAIVYDILLVNPELTPISGLTLTLNLSGGLIYQSVSGASLDGNPGGTSGMTFTVPTLAEESSTHVLIHTRTVANLGSLSNVTSTIRLTAGSTSLTPESRSQATISHRVDGQAPTVSIHALNGAAIAASGQPFTGFASDLAPDGLNGSGVAAIEVSLNGTEWHLAEGTLAWSILLAPSAGQAQPVLHARAKDQCQQTSAEVTQTFSIDTQGPVVTWSTPAAVTSALAAIGGTANDTPAGSLVQNVEVQLDNENAAWQAAQLSMPNADGLQSWVWNWITPREDGKAHQMRVRASDPAGNTTLTGWQPVVVDTIAPQLTIDLPIDPPGGPLLSGSVTDGAGVKEVAILVYGPQGSSSRQTVAVGADGIWTYTPGPGWSLGTYALRVQATDIHDNQSLKGPYLISVTDTAITNLSASVVGKKMIQETLTFSATIASGSNATFSWDFGDGTTGAGQSADHTYAQPGEYKVTVTASNHVSELSAGVTLRILIGETTTTFISSQSVGLTGQPVTFSAAVAPVAPAQGTPTGSVSFFEGTTLLAKDVALLNGSAEFTTNTLPAGLHTIHAVYSGDDDWVGSTSKDGTYLSAAPAFTVSWACVDALVPQEGPARFNVTLTNTGNVELTLSANADLQDGSSPIPAGTTFRLAASASKTFQQTVTGSFTGQAAVSNPLVISGVFSIDNEKAWESKTEPQAEPACRVGSRVNLIKLTQGLPDPSKTWTFSLWAGVKGFGGTRLATSSTNGIATGLLQFNNINLDKLNKAYTLCEENVPAGWTSFWQVDSNGDGVIAAADAILLPYNPDAAGNPPQDLGNRCVDFGIQTGVDLLSYGGTLLFQVDNTYPGGDPRSPGYWKNWNRVTGGGQAANAARNGGYQNGYWLLEDVLDPGIGGGITWDDLLADTLHFPITKAAVAVDILDQREIANENLAGDGPKHSNDAAYTLAMHLLAAQLNFGAGARTCDAAIDAALAGEQLLDKLDFNGTGSYLLNNNKKIKNDYDLALQLAKTLDQYNNGLLCSGPAVSFANPASGALVKGLLTIKVNALDKAPVTQVEFFVDGVSLCIDTTLGDGWSTEWNSGSVADGPHVLKAVATNNLAQTGSADISVIVANLPNPPLVAIKSPADGATVTSTSVNIVAEASAPSGIKQVEFLANQASIGVDVDGTDGWTAAWNLSQTANGAYALTATVTANDGQTSSQTIHITVAKAQVVQISILQLNGASQWTKPNTTWEVTLTVKLDKQLAGALVTGSWSSGGTGTCTTKTDGTCTIGLAGLNKRVTSVTFTVNAVTLPGATYTPGITAATLNQPK